jgi:hypothetical protein
VPGSMRVLVRRLPERDARRCYALALRAGPAEHIRNVSYGRKLRLHQAVDTTVSTKNDRSAIDLSPVVREDADSSYGLPGTSAFGA